MDSANFAVLVAAVVGLLAVIGARGARSLQLPAPAIFLGAGVAVASIWPEVHDRVELRYLPVIGTFALILILFEGGFANGGWPRVRPAVGIILGTGVIGTLVTALLLALACHYVVGLSWAVSSLISVALAPTDPAAVFSVLGTQDVSGRSGVVLEGESGANDPVGIALMAGVIDYLMDDGGVSGVASTFVAQLCVGVVVGVVVGLLAARLLNRIDLATPALHALAVVAAALGTFAIASSLHGSGFLAVFVAGLVMGGGQMQSQRSTESFLGVSAALSEFSMFTILGLTVPLAAVGDHLWKALVVFAFLTFLVRPIVMALLLAPTTLNRNEQMFVAWGGLKGAVPILLASFPVIAGVDGSKLVYAVVFVAVAASILVQGSSLPFVARRFGLLAENPAQ
jgi:cell volume regulation protein A